jgi:hypothetical protein
MNRLLAKAGRLSLLFALLPPLAPRVAAQTGQITAKQATNTETEKEKQEDAKNRSKLMKTHFANGNQAMQDAQAIRQQLQAATKDQKSDACQDEGGLSDGNYGISAGVGGHYGEG